MRFVIHEKLNWRAPKNSSKSKLEVMDLFDSGYISLSDLYILYAIHVFTFATTSQVLRYIKAWKNVDKTLLVPDELEGLTSRLDALNKASMLRRSKFNDKYAKTMDSLSVTSHGYNFMKKKLYFGGNYDEYLGASPAQEQLKYLALNEVVLRHLELPEGYNMGTDPVYYSHEYYFLKAKKKNITTYGYMKTKKILFEPYLTSCENGYSDDHMRSVEEERMYFIRFYLEESLRKMSSNRICFICDSIEGVKDLSKKYLVNFEETLLTKCFIVIPEQKGIIVPVIEENKFKLKQGSF